MAGLRKYLAAGLASAFLLGGPLLVRASLGADAEDIGETGGQPVVAFDTQIIGNTAFDSIQMRRSIGPKTYIRHVPIRRSFRYCLYSHWQLRNLNQDTLERHYGVFI